MVSLGFTSLTIWCEVIPFNSVLSMLNWSLLCKVLIQLFTLLLLGVPAFSSEGSPSDYVQQ